MRIFILLLSVLPLLQISCDNSVNYIADFKEQYALNCVLRSDKDVQFATLKRSYPPGAQSAAADVQNALVRLLLPDTTMTFSDSVVSDNPNSAVNYVYYLKNFRPPKNTRMVIEAFLPDDKYLYAETKSAQFSTVLLETEELTLPAMEEDAAYYTWRILGQRDSLILFPSVYIRYYVSRQDTSMKFKEVDGTYFADLRTYRIANHSLSAAMSEISNGISDKSQIHIINAVFEIKLCDFMLGTYVAAARTFEDEFSIRISATDFTNINGGFGIFGTYISETFNLLLSAEYVNSFGYAFGRN